MRARTAVRDWLGPLAALLLGVSAVNPAIASKADNSIRFASEQTIENIDPYFTITPLGGIVALNVWDTLIYRDPQTGAYRGNLATAWHWIDDRTLELDLRQGVRFHNGAEFDSDDVVFTLNYIANPANKAVLLSLVRWLDRVEKIDRYKVRIVTKQPFPAAIALLAAPSLVIHPHEYYAKAGPRGMNAKPIGSGPFRVVEHALGKYIRLQRNPNYFSGGPKSRPKIEKVEIRLIPDAQTKVAEILAGGLDLIMNVARDQAEQLRGIRNLQIVSGDTIRFAHVGMNSLPATPTPALRDIRVRRAIMHAIDRETMAKFLLGGGARVLHAECHPSQFGCTDDGAPRYEYNPLRARQLLKEAGYPNGFDIDLYAFQDRNQAEAIVGYLRAVDIRARLRFVQVPVFNTARRTGRAALLFGNFASFSVFDVSNSASYYFEFSPEDLSRDSQIRDLLLRGDSAMDPDARKYSYAKALALIAERAYVLPLYSMPVYYLADNDLVFNAYTDERLRFWEMYYK